MKKIIILGLAVSALALAGCGKSSNPATGGTQESQESHSSSKSVADVQGLLECNGEKTPANCKFVDYHKVDETVDGKTTVKICQVTKTRAATEADLAAHKGKIFKPREFCQNP